MAQNLILACLTKGLSMTGCVLCPGETYVGRTIDCGILIPDVSISRRHALVTVTDTEAVTVTDLESLNGTFVDDSPVDSSVLLYGQVVRFGRVSFRLIAVNVSDDEFNWEISTYKTTNSREISTADETGEILSPAQKRVFDLLAKGLRKKEVAEQLHLSYHTVHAHTREIYRLFGVHSRAELLSYFIRDDGVQ